MNLNVEIYDAVATYLFGFLLASIELSSKYKDDPTSVLLSSPGLLYLAVNALICVSGLYLMNMFGLGIEVDDALPDLAQRTMDILQASLSSFFIMRSSFLKLGHNSQIDLGLNAVLKKLLEIVDREVDRVRAVQRSKEITNLFKHVCHTNTKYIFSLCLHVMQNVSIEEAAEIQRKIEELDSVIGTSDTSIMDLNMKQLEIGLALYNIVGIGVLTAAVDDLDLRQVDDNENEPQNKSTSDKKPMNENRSDNPDVITTNTLFNVKFKSDKSKGESDDTSDL